MTIHSRLEPALQRSKNVRIYIKFARYGFLRSSNLRCGSLDRSTSLGVVFKETPLVKVRTSKDHRIKDGEPKTPRLFFHT